jgi:hypothetical protein
LDRTLCGNQSRSGRGGEEKNSQLLPGLKLTIIQPVAQRYTAKLSQCLVECYTKRRLVIHFPYEMKEFLMEISLYFGMQIVVCFGTMTMCETAASWTLNL